VKRQCGRWPLANGPRLVRWALASAGVAGALFVSAACRVDDGPQDSSGSHWLSCQSDADCERYAADASCDERYCENAEGVRLLAEDFAGVSPGTVESTSADNPTSNGQGGTTQETAATETAEGAPTAAGGAASEPSPSGSETSSAPSASSAAPECLPPPALLPTENIHDGDYIVTGLSNIEAAALLTEITGDLTFSQRAVDDFSEVELPGLLRVGGSLNAADATVTSIALPNLKSLGGDLQLTGNGQLVRVDFRSLESIAGNVLVSENLRLEALGLDSLVVVSGSFEVGASILANCEVQSVQGTLGLPQDYSAGRADCECVVMCERLAALCP
jgi:hypothetical protein